MLVVAENPLYKIQNFLRILSNSGILVPGGFGSRGTDGKMAAAEWARKMKKPYLGR